MQTKLALLKDILGKMDKVLVACSGGVDSVFLLWAALQVAGLKVRAVTARSSMVSCRELETARFLVSSLGVEHLVLNLNPLVLPAVRFNSHDRCYHCKRFLYEGFLSLAREHGLNFVVDGENSDDLRIWRPGRRARDELGVRSPLQEAGINKKEIRFLSRQAGLPVWNKPAAPCLLTRFPYGEEITEKKLQLVAEAEGFLEDRGYSPVRVRCHNFLARLEVRPEEFGRLLQEREKLFAFLKKLGFTHVSLDLEGYRSGSFDRLP